MVLIPPLGLTLHSILESQSRALPSLPLKLVTSFPERFFSVHFIEPPFSFLPSLNSFSSSINFGVSCLGQANGTQQLASLGDGRINRTQGNGDGNNGVLRYNYGNAFIGTCQVSREQQKEQKGEGLNRKGSSASFFTLSFSTHLFSSKLTTFFHHLFFSIPFIFLRKPSKEEIISDGGFKMEPKPIQELIS